MMKMAMKLDKSQLQRVYKFTTVGAYNLNKDIFVMAGYKNISFLLVGGAGGYGGDSGSNARVAECGAGGGGGGTLSGILPLSSLATNTAFSVGGVGTNGVKGADGIPGTDGTDGGYSTFGGYIAYGGGGASGGFAQFAGGHVTRDTVNPSVGGSGGGNNQGWGSGGAGGRNAYYAGSPTQFRFAAVAPTNGNYADQGNGWGGGVGGGGGYGMFRWAGATDTNAISGAYGSNPTVLGQYGLASGFTGGVGGGGDIAFFTGATEYFGGWPTPSGVVVLVFS